MISYINGHKLVTGDDLVKFPLNENLAYGVPNYGLGTSNLHGNSTSSISFSSQGDWSYLGFNLNAKFKKGDLVTFSALGNLTSNPNNQRQYKISIFDSSISNSQIDGDPLLTLGSRNSVTAMINQDTPIDTNLVVLIYCGMPGHSTGNAITVSNIKVERGSVATGYAPSPLDYLANKSDVTSLQEQINQLKSKLGGKSPL